MVEVAADGTQTRWRFDRTFLTSNWTCIWGRGCHGIEAERAAVLQLGCCSVGAELDGVDEAMNVSALAATIPAEIFQFHDEARRGGVFSDETRTNTRVVDGACIFLNRPGFDGGAGCALHLAAVRYDEPPMDWKPSVCWQLPVKVDWEMGADAVEVATVRAWSRADWGDDGDEMSWCCTDRHEPDAYVGERPVIESLADELEGIVGTPVFLQIRQRLAPHAERPAVSG